MAEAKKSSKKDTKKTAKSVKITESIKSAESDKKSKLSKPATEATAIQTDASDANGADDTNKEAQSEETALDSSSIAKAGKRSSKSIKEAEAEQAKEDRKANRAKAAADIEEAPKIRPKTRSKTERAGKKFREASKLVEPEKLYSLSESIDLACKTSTTKFDATVEMHIRLGVDPRQADQNLRDNFVLPAGTGKTVRVAVFAEADDIAIAKKAGADIAANEEFLQQLDKQKMDFDILIATPSQMSKLGKYARMLGPKGLMPNPKSGTVTTDVAKAVEQAKAGRVEYRVDSTGIVHLGIGKVSFGKAKLLQNAQAVAASIKTNKPASVKGNYVKSVYLSTTMGPGIAVAASEL